MSRSYFVTGGSGFLGSFFVSHLLEHRQRVVALVRAGAQERLFDNLRRIAAPAPHHAASFALLKVVEGDIRVPGLGLSPDDRALVTSEATEVWHFAAAFGLGERGRDRVVDTNVTGTANVVALAAACGRLARLNLLSTAYAAPTAGGIARESLGDPARKAGNVYEESKVRAEHLAVAALAGAPVPLRILRPSIVVGRSSDGLSFGFTGYQGVYRALYLLRARLRVNLGAEFDGNLRLRVDADPDLRLNVVPVDYAVAAMAALDDAARDGPSIFHITSDEGATLRALFGRAERSLGIEGIELSAAHDYAGRPRTSAEKLFQRRIEFQAPYLRREVVFDVHDFRAAVPAGRLAAPVIDDALVDRCNAACLADLESAFAAGARKTPAQAADSRAGGMARHPSTTSG